MSLVIRFIFTLMGSLPLELRIVLGRIAGYFVSLFAWRETKIANLQLRWILKNPSPSPVITEIYKNLGQNFFESLNFKPYLANIEKHVTLADPDNLLTELQFPKQPIIILGAHTGNWDFMASYLAYQKVNFATLGKATKNPFLQEFLKITRENYGVRTLWRGNQQDTRHLIKFLKTPGTIGALIDQDIQAVSCWLDFMGKPVKTAQALVDLGIRLSAKFITCFNIRTGPRSFKIILSSPQNYSTANDVLQFYNDKLGQLIADHPEQWVWIHKRWRSPNADKTFSTKEYLEYMQNEISNN